MTSVLGVYRPTSSITSPIRVFTNSSLPYGHDFIIYVNRENRPDGTNGTYTGYHDERSFRVVGAFEVRFACVEGHTASQILAGLPHRFRQSIPPNGVRSPPAVNPDHHWLEAPGRSNS